MQADTIKYLKKLPLFQGLPEDVIVEMAREVKQHKLVRNDVLFLKGDPGSSLYIIRTGWVKITTEDQHGDELVLNHCGPGETVGEFSLIDEEPRSAGVVALSALDTLELKRETFLRVLDREPLLALDVMRNIVARGRFATTYIEKAIDLSHRIAEGDYSFAIDQIQNIQSTFVDVHKADETRASELLSAFFHMVEGVRSREENLKQQVYELTVKIDEKKRQEEVKSLTQSPFFSNLKSAAQKLRQQRDLEESEQG
jgi:CRP/FNR family transcriptional regulator, cyclic AMP receptor protein